MLTSTSFAADGWGQKQSQDTIKGLLLGGSLGAVVGHQSGKQKEGIIIGSVIGSFLGNRTGKGRDTRHAEEDMQRARYEQSRSRLYQTSTARPTPSYSSYSSSTQTDPLVLQAKQRAEQVEKELAQEKERIRAEQERSRLLAELEARERNAREQLQSLRR